MGILDLFTQSVEPSSSDEEAEEEPPPADIWPGLLSGQQLRKLSCGSVTLSRARPGGLSASLGGSHSPRCVIPKPTCSNCRVPMNLCHCSASECSICRGSKELCTCTARAAKPTLAAITVPAPIEGGRSWQAYGIEIRNPYGTTDLSGASSPRQQPPSAADAEPPRRGRGTEKLLAPMAVCNAVVGTHSPQQAPPTSMSRAHPGEACKRKLEAIVRKPGEPEDEEESLLATTESPDALGIVAPGKGSVALGIVAPGKGSVALGIVAPGKGASRGRPGALSTSGTDIAASAVLAQRPASASDLARSFGNVEGACSPPPSLKITAGFSSAVSRLRAARAAIEAKRERLSGIGALPPTLPAKPTIRPTDFRDWQHNTSFFRDGHATWGCVAERILFHAARAAMLDHRPHTQHRPRPLRVWSCGCSSGEELFTVRLAYEQWVSPTFVAAYGHAPAFSGVGTDRSAKILETAQDEGSLYGAAELALVPEYARLCFHEVPKLGLPKEVAATPCSPSCAASSANGLFSGGGSAGSAAGTEARADAARRDLGREARFTMASSVRRDLKWWVEDTCAESEASEPLAGDALAGGARHGASGSSSHATTLYDLILCRYSIFLYAADHGGGVGARRAVAAMVRRLTPAGVLLLGASDKLPNCAAEFLEPIPAAELAIHLGEYAWFERAPRPINAWRRKVATRNGAAVAPPPAGSPIALQPGLVSAGSAVTSALLAADSVSSFRHALGMRPMPEKACVTMRAVAAQHYGLRAAAGMAAAKKGGASRTSTSDRGGSS